MTHYATLGVPPDAAPAAIKAAYRSLAQANHPDKETGDTATFQRIQKAWDTLGDAEKRAHYDATGEDFTAGPTLTDRAMAAISEVMDQAIRNCDVLHDDIIEEAAAALEDAMVGMRAKRVNMTKARDKMARAIERTKAKAGNVDQLAMVLAFLDKRLADPLKNLDDSLAEGEMAVKILRDHEYTVDARPAPSQNGQFFQSMIADVWKIQGAR